jgi:hypothetical protein
MISCSNIKLDSFWAGDWQSTWVVKTGSGVLSGSLRVKGHYFETGNVQLSLEKDFDSIVVKDIKNAT